MFFDNLDKELVAFWSDFSCRKGNFMLKRLAMLEPPYLITILLMIAYRKLRVILIPGSEDLTPDTTDLLLHIGYLVSIMDGEWASSVFWTLSIEFQFYLSISLMFSLAMSNRKIWRYIFYGLFLLMPFTYSSLGALPAYAPLFLAGILYALHEYKMIDLKEFSAVCIIAFIISFFSLPVNGAIAAFLTLFLIHWIPQWSARILNFLADISYSLYLIHPVSGLILVHMLSHHFREPWQKILIVVAGTLLSVLAAWIFYRLVDLPSTKLAARIRYSNPEPLPAKQQGTAK